MEEEEASKAVAVPPRYDAGRAGRVRMMLG